MRDVEAFLAALPELGVRHELIGVYKAHLTWASAGLARIGRGELSEHEIPMLVEIARKEGAGPGRIRNLETACLTYVRWRAMQGSRSRDATASTRGQPAVRAKKGLSPSAVAGLLTGVALMAGLVLLRPSRVSNGPERTARQPTAAGETAAAPPERPPDASGECAVLRRCCGGEADSLFCAVALKGDPSECRQAISSIEELGIADCRAMAE